MCDDNEEWCKIWSEIDGWVQLPISKNQDIQCLSIESTEELCLIALKIDTKFEGKLTSTFRNVANFCLPAEK